MALKNKDGIKALACVEDAVATHEALLHPAYSILVLAKDFEVLIFGSLYQDKEQLKFD